VYEHALRHITNRFGTLARLTTLLTTLLHNLAIVGNMAKEGGDIALLVGAKSAGDVGGAIHNEGSNPSLTNVQISGNQGSTGGGSICNLAGSPNLVQAENNSTFCEAAKQMCTF